MPVTERLHHNAMMIVSIVSRPFREECEEGMRVWILFLGGEDHGHCQFNTESFHVESDAPFLERVCPPTSLSTLLQKLPRNFLPQQHRVALDHDQTRRTIVQTAQLVHAEQAHAATFLAAIRAALHAV